MGYISRLTGFIEIDPPLSWVEFRDTDFYGDKADHADRSIVIETDAKRVDTDDGRFEIITGVGISPISEDEGKWYGFREDLSLLLSQVSAFDHTFTGSIIRIGSDQGDIERSWVKDGVVFSEKAELRWPDGSPAEWD